METPQIATPSSSSASPGRGTRPAPDRTRVSVIVPTYNRCESLRRCLLGVLSCEVDGMEVDVHVVDDGSPDRTRAVVDELARLSAGPIRLHYHRQANAGHSAAVNRGLREAGTELVLITDDDCVPEPGWIGALVGAPWEEGVGAAGGRIVSAETSTAVSRYCRHIRFNEFPPDDGPIRYVNSANSAYPRQVLEEMGGMEPLIRLGGEDIELSWRITLAGYRLEYRPAAVVRHYHRETLRALLKVFWMRGYASTLRNALWKEHFRPGWGRLAKETYRQLWWPLLLFALPLRAARLRRRGVEARDAPAFALLEWLEMGVNRAGKIAMLLRILTRLQRLDRETPAPAGDSGAAPPWIRRVEDRP